MQMVPWKGNPGRHQLFCGKITNNKWVWIHLCQCSYLLSWTRWCPCTCQTIGSILLHCWGNSLYMASSLPCWALSESTWYILRWWSCWERLRLSWRASCLLFFTYRAVQTIAHIWTCWNFAWKGEMKFLWRDWSIYGWACFLFSFWCYKWGLKL